MKHSQALFQEWNFQADWEYHHDPPIMPKTKIQANTSKPVTILQPLLPTHLDENRAAGLFSPLFPYATFVPSPHPRKVKPVLITILTPACIKANLA